MDSFPAAKYGMRTLKDLNSDYQTNSYNRKTAKDIVVTHNDEEVKISMATLHELVDTMRTNANKKVSEMSENELSQFNQLRRYVIILQVNDKYEILYRMIKDKFKDVTTAIPGTVGAFCNGCSINVKNVPGGPSCSPLCAGGLSDKSEPEVCVATVMLAEYVAGTGFMFTSLSKSDPTNENPAPAAIYLNYRTYDDFPGFTETELSSLKKFNIKSIQFMRYSPDGTSVIPLTDKPLPVDDIRKRSESSSMSMSGSGTAGVVVMFLIILIIVISFMVYRYKSK